MGWPPGRGLLLRSWPVTPALTDKLTPSGLPPPGRAAAGGIWGGQTAPAIPDEVAAPRWIVDEPARLEALGHYSALNPGDG